MFSSGPVVNNVLACMTDKIVCATFSADPTATVQDDQELANKEAKSVSSRSSSTSPKHSKTRIVSAAVLDQPGSPSSATVLAPVSSLALAAAPLLTSNFAFDTRGVTVLRNYSAPNSRRSSEQPDLTTSISAQLSLIGDHTNSGALIYHTEPSSRTISVQSLCHLPADQSTVCSPVMANHRRQSETSSSSTTSSCSSNSQRPRQLQQGQHHPLSPKVKHKPDEQIELPLVSSSQYEVDSSVQSAQITPESTPGRSTSRSRINTEDRERFTEEVTV